MSISASSSLLSLVALRGLRQADAAYAKAIERLATGKRINRGSDDPAGMMAASAMEARQREIEARVARYERENAMLGAREGALSVVSEMMIELKGVVVRAANTGATSLAEREALQIEADSIVDGLRHIVSTTEFNGEKLFSGLNAFGSHSIQVGDTMMSHLLDSLASGGALNLLTGDLSAADSLVDRAVENVSGLRAGVGIRMKEIESSLTLLAEENEALAGEISRIVDADFAKETAELVRAQVMRQAGIFAIQAALKHRGDTATALLGGLASV